MSCLYGVNCPSFDAYANTCMQTVPLDVLVLRAATFLSAVHIPLGSMHQQAKRNPFACNARTPNVRMYVPLRPSPDLSASYRYRPYYDHHIGRVPSLLYANMFGSRQAFPYAIPFARQGLAPGVSYAPVVRVVCFFRPAAVSEGSSFLLCLN